MNVRQQIWGVEPSVAKRRRPRQSRSRSGDAGTPAPARPRVRMPLPANGEQLSFADQRTWGGPRPDARRTVQSVRRKVPHRVRPAHASYNPTHVTMRRAKGLPGFRVKRLHRLLREAIRETRREGFRIVHDSIQSDHLHMLVEADDASRPHQRHEELRGARRHAVPKDEHAGERAWTWLLDEGWSTVGLGWLHVGEVPRALWH